MASSVLLCQNLNAVNWKLHIADLEDAAYADEHAQPAAIHKLNELKGDGEAPTTRYLGFLWKIAHNLNPDGRAILFEELDFLTFAHYVWHAWGFKQEKAMEHQAAEKRQKTEWILRRPQDMKSAIRIKMLSQNTDMRNTATEESKKARKEHEDFKGRLSAALKPIQTKLEANKSAVPTEFSAFWDKFRETNNLKSADRLIANSIGGTPPKSADHDILGQLWEVYDTVWHSKE